MIWPVLYCPVSLLGSLDDIGVGAICRLEVNFSRLLYGRTIMGFLLLRWWSIL